MVVVPLEIHYQQFVRTEHLLYSTWKRNHSRASSFHSFLSTPRSETEKDRSDRDEIRETVERKRGSGSTPVSLYRDGTIKQGRIRGSLRAIILDPVVVGVCIYIYIYTLSVKGISRSTFARAYLCVRAPATIRQGYIGGQTSARVTGGDLCLRYAGRPEPKGDCRNRERKSAR